VLKNEAGARIRLVKAAPGSGKTWLVGELIRGELEAWAGRGGIAALSFTRVARDAIADALGGMLPPHPHFVGTLDSFVYRYVFRVFGPAIKDWLGPLRLLPASVADHQGDWATKGLTVAIGNRRVRLFDIHVRRIEGDKPQLLYKTNNMGRAEPVPKGAQRAVWKQKEWLWRTARVASHSDIAYLSWRIATHATHGKTIRRLLADRFPLVVLDEVQDTGWFLADTVHALLGEETTRGVIVGDRDQAIYEFGGAQPGDLDRFDSLEGAVHFPMRESFRCPTKVCQIATALSWQKATVTPSGSREGHAILYVYEQQPDIEQLCSTVEKDVGASPTTVLARGKSGMSKLVSMSPTAPKFGSRPLQHLWSACNHLRAGRAKEALGGTQAAISRVLFATEGWRSSDLLDVGLDEDAWRALAASTLCVAVSLPCEDSLFDWCALALNTLKDQLGDLTTRPNVSKRLRSGGKKLKEAPASDYMATTRDGPSRRCTTVHGAKGETHEVTMLFVPKTSRPRCPGTTWFSEAPEHGEERRIAFVAASRPREAFVLCIHKTTYERLQTSASSFLAEFDVRHLTIT